MPGRGRRWKTLVSPYGESKLDIEFPTVVHRPGKSPAARFPHSHSADDLFHPKPKTTRLAPFGRSPNPFMKGGFIPPPPSRKPPNFQAHPALESKAGFRLTPHWNPTSISGSFLDWKMLPTADVVVLIIADTNLYRSFTN